LGTAPLTSLQSKMPLGTKNLSADALHKENIWLKFNLMYTCAFVMPDADIRRKGNLSFLAINCSGKKVSHILHFSALRSLS